MKCKNCSSRELLQENGYIICLFCRSRFLPEAEDIHEKETEIGVDNDIQMLLQKCADDPANRRRYASLILDLDPTNPVAKDFLT